MNVINDLRNINFSAAPTVTAVGIFDGVHIAHRRVINTAAELARSLGARCCVFTFDTKSVSTKGGTPLLTEDEKLRRLEESGAQTVVSLDFSLLRDMQPQSFVNDILLSNNALGSRAVVCGKDLRFGKNAAGDIQLLETFCAKAGVTVTALELIHSGGEVISTTRIKNLFENGECEKANELLGEDICYTLPVTHGNEIGRKMGFPTINQAFPKGLFLPRFGVYCSKAVIGGKVYLGVSNIGVKPTIGRNSPCIETHIFDFSGDLYGESVTVSLKSFLRTERRFESRGQLFEQIAEDKHRAQEYFNSNK